MAGSSPIKATFALRQSGFQLFVLPPGPRAPPALEEPGNRGYLPPTFVPTVAVGLPSPDVTVGVVAGVGISVVGVIPGVSVAVGTPIVEVGVGVSGGGVGDSVGVAVAVSVGTGVGVTTGVGDDTVVAVTVGFGVGFGRGVEVTFAVGVICGDPDLLGVPVDRRGWLFPPLPRATNVALLLTVGVT
jgi:hypothetical protein